MGRVHEALHRLLTLLPTSVSRSSPPPKHGKRVYALHARKYGSLVNERARVTAAVTDEPLPLLPSSPRDPSVLFNPLLAINGRAKVEIEIRNRLSSLGNFFTARGVHLWDFDRSRFAALTEHYSSPLRLEEIYTWTRLEGRLHRGRVQRTIYC